MATALVVLELLEWLGAAFWIYSLLRVVTPSKNQVLIRLAAGALLSLVIPWFIASRSDVISARTGLRFLLLVVVNGTLGLAWCGRARGASLPMLGLVGAGLAGSIVIVLQGLRFTRLF